MNTCFVICACFLLVLATGENLDSGYETKTTISTQPRIGLVKNFLNNLNVNLAAASEKNVAEEQPQLNGRNLEKNQDNLGNSEIVKNSEGSVGIKSLTKGISKAIEGNQGIKWLGKGLTSTQSVNETKSSTDEDSVQTAVFPGEEDDEKDVCFPGLGCFAMGKPWKSLLRPVRKPFSPEKIQTTIFYYSRENINQQKNITLYPQINMNNAPFDPKKLTAIIVHGFASSGDATWMKDMKNAYLKKVNANVMLVDWGKGSNLFSYLQVAGNTRTVGKQLSLFVNYLIEHYNADPSKFHLIGHSLGAQICSYLAKDVKGIDRLTALDPAQPAFEGFDKIVRLDKSDADFVDVIHTDAKPFIPTLGFGMIAPHGHVDFYMNGGFDQPGCKPPPKEELPEIKSILDLAKFPVEVLGKMLTCPHSRAHQFLTEAFNETENCIFWGRKASFQNVVGSITNTLTHGVLQKVVALSSKCSKENCIPLGFATRESPLRGSFVVTTSARAPYCIPEPGIHREVEILENSEPESFHKSLVENLYKNLPINK